MTNPFEEWLSLLFCKIAEKPNQACGAQYSLVYKRNKFLGLVLVSGLAMQLLLMHNESNHKQTVQTGEAGTQRQKAEKVCRPTFKMGSSEDDFIFLCLFESYKRSCQLTDVADIRDQLLACCEMDLRRDLLRYLGTGLDAQSEAELLAEIKRIAVVTRSNLVNVVSLMSGLGKCVQVVSDMYCD